MSDSLTPAANQKIVDQAWGHILKGGGIVPDDGGSELEDAIAAVASAHFGSDELRTQLESALTALAPEMAESLFAPIWGLVGVYGDAGFTLGATVAIKSAAARRGRR